MKRERGARRALLIGAGEVGAKHIAALAAAPGVELVAIADPAPTATIPSGVRLFHRWREALWRTCPDLVVVAAPPSVVLEAARCSASMAEAVIVEKPVATTAAALERSQPEDERIYVAFQPHFAPGLDRLLADPPELVRAEVTLSCRRDPHYFRGWRRTRAGAGGVLHQQAIHGLVLALRLMDGPAAVRAVAVHHPRDLEESEDRISVDLGLSGGRRIEINARVDADSDADRHHTVLLHTRDRRTLAVRGRNLEAGLDDPANAPTDRELRVQMYTAAMNASHAPARHHPCLFPLRALGRPLEVIEGIYRHAYTHRPGSAPA